MWSARMLRWPEAGVGSGTALSRCLKTVSWERHTHARDRHTRYLYGNEAPPCGQHPGAPLPDPQGETTTLLLVCSDAFRYCMCYITGVRRCSACSTEGSGVGRDHVCGLGWWAGPGCDLAQGWWASGGSHLGTIVRTAARNLHVCL